MKTANILTLLAFIQCAQLTHAMETKDQQDQKSHKQFVALLLSIHNYNTRLATLYIEQDTALSTDPRLPNIAPEIEATKAQLPELESRHTDLFSQAENDAPSFFSDTSDPRHAAVQRTKEIMADAKNDAKDKKEFLIKHSFHHVAVGQTRHDKVQQVLQAVQANDALMQTLKTRLESDKALNHQDRKALTTRYSYTQIATSALLAAQIEDLQKHPKSGNEALLKQLLDAQKK